MNTSSFYIDYDSALLKVCKFHIHAHQKRPGFILTAVVKHVHQKDVREPLLYDEILGIPRPQICTNIRFSGSSERSGTDTVYRHVYMEPM